MTSLQQFLNDLAGTDLIEQRAQGLCVPPPIGCGKPIDPADFADDTERREFDISGLCHQCQVEVFGG